MLMLSVPADVHGWIMGSCFCSYVENHAVIVEIEPDCLMAKSGVEVGDVLDELCGEHVVESSRGKVSE